MGRLWDGRGVRNQGRDPSPSRARGADFVCIASGPSLTADDCERVRAWRQAKQEGRCVIVINTSFRAAPWADVLYACDLAWWDRHVAEVRDVFKGELWTQTKEAAVRHGLNRVEGRAGRGLCREPGVIHQGGNSGYQAIGMAVLQGARRVVLLGYDMQRTGGRSHWHGDHPGGLRNNSPFASWLKRFGDLADDLASEGVDVINATRETALQCFRRANLEDVLC